MKLGVLYRISLIVGFVLVLSLRGGKVSAQFRLPADTATSQHRKPELPPLNLAIRDEGLRTPDSSKLIIPAYKQGFFCRFEDKMQMKWKLPLNLELK